MTPAIEYRRATADDLDFVVSSWVSSYKTAHAAGILSISPLDVACPSCGAGIPHDFAAVMKHTVRAVLGRPGVEVWVVTDPSAAAPNDLHGHLVVERGANLPSYRPPDYKLHVTTAREPMVHYVFVKRAFRGFGFARGLLAAASVAADAPLLYSCKTADVSALERAGKLPRARWAPLSVRFAKESQIP